jgi:hypothetical protein
MRPGQKEDPPQRLRKGCGDDTQYNERLPPDVDLGRVGANQSLDLRQCGLGLAQRGEEERCAAVNWH